MERSKSVSSWWIDLWCQGDLASWHSRKNNPLPMCSWMTPTQLMEKSLNAKSLSLKTNRRRFHQRLCHLKSIWRSSVTPKKSTRATHLCFRSLRFRIISQNINQKCSKTKQAIATSRNIYNQEKALNWRTKVEDKAVSEEVQRKNRSQSWVKSRVRAQAKGREILRIDLQTRQIGDKNSRNKLTKRLETPS